MTIIAQKIIYNYKRKIFIIILFTPTCFSRKVAHEIRTTEIYLKT